MAKKRDKIIANIISSMPGDLRPYAKIIVPVLSDMVAKQGLDKVRIFLFTYGSADDSWNRKLLRNMPIPVKCKWRQVMSDKRIKELGEVKLLHLRAIRMRRAVVQRIWTTALEIAIGAIGAL